MTRTPTGLGCWDASPVVPPAFARFPRRSILLHGWVTTLLLLAGSAAHAQAPHVTAETAWSRATPPGVGTAAVYVTLTSPIDDTLVGASSPASSGADVHEMTMDGTIMRMRPVSGGLALPAGHPVKLQPSGYHIMLTGLRAPLKQGQAVQVRLTFANSAPLDIVARIAAIGAAAAPHGTPNGTPGATPHDGMAGMKMP